MGKSRFWAICVSQKSRGANLAMGTAEMDQKRANSPHSPALPGFPRYKTLPSYTRTRTTVTERHASGAHHLCIGCQGIKFHHSSPQGGLQRRLISLAGSCKSTESCTPCAHSLLAIQYAKYSVPQARKRFSLTPMHPLIF